MNKNKLRELIYEAYAEVLSEQDDVLPTSTQEILGKFPTLKRNLENLLTSEFESFVNSIDWVAPKPTTFRVNLMNGEQFFMKWLGKGFEAQLGGKKYFLDKVNEFQQALDKLNELLRFNPIGGEKEEPAPEMGIEEPAATETPPAGGEEEAETTTTEPEFEEPGA